MCGAGQSAGAQSGVKMVSAKLSSDAGLFQQFLAQELRHCARDAYLYAYTDPVLVRYRALLRAQRSTQLSDVETQEYTQLLNRIYSRWRWRQATAQVMKRRTPAV